MSHTGALRSENAGTSNRNAGESPARRKTKVSFAMLISEGLVGPKGMTKVGPDGQMVNIPSLVFDAMGRRRVVCWVPDWIGARSVRVTLR